MKSIFNNEIDSIGEEILWLLNMIPVMWPPLVTGSRRNPEHKYFANNSLNPSVF